MKRDLKSNLKLLFESIITEKLVIILMPLTIVYYYNCDYSLSKVDYFQRNVPLKFCKREGRRKNLCYIISYAINSSQLI